MPKKKQTKKLPRCSCGKTAKEHITKQLLNVHHYWYVHKVYIDGCSHCEREKKEKKGGG